jgi:hypothetical protein
MAIPEAIRRRAKRVMFAAAATVGFLVVLELGTRGMLLVSPGASEAVENYREAWHIEDSPEWTYRAHPFLGYVHNISRHGESYTRYGFAGTDIPLEKPDGELRIACFGGSTTDGPDAWPSKLEAVLRERHPDRSIRVLNFGVGGWSSAPNLVAFVLIAQSFEPDVVIVHSVNNDIAPMQTDDFKVDYSHFSTAMQARNAGEMDSLGWTYRIGSALTRSSDLYVYASLWIGDGSRRRTTLSGLTTRRVETGGKISREGHATYLRNLVTFGNLATSIGATPVFMTMPWLENSELQRLGRTTVGAAGWERQITEQNRRMRTLAQEHNWAVADLERDLEMVPEEFQDAIHMNQEGEMRKALGVADTLRAHDILP